MIFKPIKLSENITVIQVIKFIIHGLQSILIHGKDVGFIFVLMAAQTLKQVYKLLRFPDL